MTKNGILLRDASKKFIEYSLPTSPSGATPSANVPQSVLPGGNASKHPSPAQPGPGPILRILVMQCQKRKKGDTFLFQGRKVKFVADPSLAPARVPPVLYARPDDTVPGLQITWRGLVVQYNQNPLNPLPADVSLPPGGLSEAWDLYADTIYAQVAHTLGAGNFYILSAGWGLVRSNYALPNYDITFAHGARQQYPSTFRPIGGPNNNWNLRDFNHLLEDYPDPFPNKNTIHATMGGNYARRLSQMLGATALTIHHWGGPPQVPPVRGNIWGHVPHGPHKGGNPRRWFYYCAANLIHGLTC